MSKRESTVRRGLTAVEFVIVIGLATLIISLLLPTLLSAQGAAGRKEAMNSLKQLGFALHSHHDGYKQFPPAFGKLGKFETEATVHVYLLPFIEQENVFNLYITEKGGEKALRLKIPVFVADMDPSRKDNKDKVEGVQNFAANLRAFSTVGMNTPHDKNIDIDKKTTFEGASRIASFTDGVSNTIAYATKYAICGEGGSRYAPSPHSKFAAFFGQNAATEKASSDSAKATFQLVPTAKECLCSPLMAQAFEKAGLLAGLCDGSVRVVGAGLSDETWNRALCPNDGNVLGKDWDN